MRACCPCQTEGLNSNSLPEGRRKSSRTLLLAVAVAITIGSSPSWMSREDADAQTRPLPPPQAVDKTDYWLRATRMTDVTAKVENGIISISLDVVKEKKIVRFEYQGNGTRIPLLAYVAPSGKAVTAVSVCEPCRSTRFHVGEKVIVCNSCYTEWNLETLKGIEGGCLKYPPDVIPNRVDKGQILIDEKTVVQWKPRI